MWPFRIRWAAMFSVPDGADGSKAVTMLREALAKDDPLEVVEKDMTLDFDVGPLFLRLDLAFKPSSRFRGIRRGRVSVRSSGNGVEVTSDLKMAWADLVGPALVFTLLSFYADIASANQAGPGLGAFLFLGAFLLVGWMLVKVIAAARFRKFVEDALRPMRPVR